MLIASWAFFMLPNSGMNFFNQPIESLLLLAGSLMWFVIPFIIWEVITRKLRKEKLKQTGKRIKSYNIE
jgi:Na+-transporting NADH:ubiquinone oxidoreductase subunit NqrD